VSGAVPRLQLDAAEDLALLHASRAVPAPAAESSSRQQQQRHGVSDAAASPAPAPSFHEQVMAAAAANQSPFELDRLVLNITSEQFQQLSDESAAALLPTLVRWSGGGASVPIDKRKVALAVAWELALHFPHVFDAPASRLLVQRLLGGMLGSAWIERERERERGLTRHWHPAVERILQRNEESSLSVEELRELQRFLGESLSVQ